jgi:hypothetical protein
MGYWGYLACATAGLAVLYCIIFLGMRLLFPPDS